MSERDPLTGCREAIVSRYRAGETVEALADDYAAYGFTSDDVRAIVGRGGKQ